MKKIKCLSVFTVLLSTLTLFAQEAADFAKEAVVEACPECLVCPECSGCFGTVSGFSVLFLIIGLAGGFFAAQKLFAKKAKSGGNDNFIALSLKDREIEELKLQLKTKDGDVETAKAEVGKLAGKIAEVLKKADEKRYSEITGAQFVGPMYEQVEMMIEKLKEDYRFLGVRTFLERELSGRIDQFNSAIRTNDGTEALRVAGLLVKDFEEAKDFYKEEK